MQLFLAPVGIGRGTGKAQGGGDFLLARALGFHFSYPADTRGIDVVVYRLTGLLFEYPQKMIFAVTRDPGELFKAQAASRGVADMFLN